MSAELRALPKSARRRPKAGDGTAVIITLRGDDIALFERTKAAVEARAGVDVTHAALIRAALKALESRQ